MRENALVPVAVDSTQHALSGPPGPVGWVQDPASKQKVKVGARSRDLANWPIRTFTYVMAERDEVPYEDCVVCGGERGRERRSANSSICKFNACQKELSRRRQEARAAGDVPPVAQRLPAPPAKCRKIKDVLGVTLCGLDLDADQRRVGKKSGYDDVQLQVRGGFGGAKDKAEDLMPDTRWVKLDDLVEAMPKRDLKKLFTFAKNLVSVLEAAEQELREGEGEEAE